MTDLDSIFKSRDITLPTKLLDLSESISSFGEWESGYHPFG